MKWIRFTIDTHTEAVDLLSYELDAIGVEGIEIEDKLPLSEEDKKTNLMKMWSNFWSSSRWFSDRPPVTVSTCSGGKHSASSFAMTAEVAWE